MIDSQHIWKYTIEAVKASEENIALRLAMLLHDVAEPETHAQEDGGRHISQHAQKGADVAETILKRLKYDNCTIETVRTLILYHDGEFVAERRLIKRWLNRVGENLFRLLLKVREADIKASTLEQADLRFHYLNDVRAVLDDILNRQECFNLKDMAVNGRDIMLAGVPAGKQVGETLNLLLNMVIDGELANDRQTLINYVNQHTNHEE